MRRALLALLVLWFVAAGPGPANAAQHNVAVSDSAFSPSAVHIAPGDDIFWCPNADNTLTHKIVADDGSFSSLDIPPRSGCTWLTFQHAGSFPYHCAYVNMHGSITVGDAAPAPTTTAAAPKTTTTRAAGPTTTRRRTATTKNVVGTRAMTATSTTAVVGPTSSVIEELDDTTTTAGQVAIKETSHRGSSAGSVAATAAIAALAAGGIGYVVYRRR